MRVVTYMGSDTRTARSVGGDAGSSVTVGPQGPPHVFAHRDEGPCARYRAAGSPPVLTAPVGEPFGLPRPSASRMLASW